MPIDFDEEDLTEALEETEQAQEVQAVPSEQDVDRQMSEVEARLEMAQYYRLLLQNELFGDKADPEIASRVENEVRDFVRTRMSVLVGVGAQPKKSQLVLSDDEMLVLRELATPEIVKTLKALVSKLLKKPSIMDPRPKPAATPSEPTLQPVSVRGPSLRKVNPRQSMRPSSSQQDQEVVDLNVAEQRPRPPVKGQRQKRLVRTITTEDGKTFKQDVTPQAKPVGIQPLPTPRTKDQIEQQMAMVSAAHERTAMRTLDKKLKGEE